MAGGTEQVGAAEDSEATSNGSLIAIAKRIRTLLGGTGSVRITDGTDEALIDAAKYLYVRERAHILAPWIAQHAPGANVQATATKAAAGANTYNVCTAFSFIFAAGATAPTAINLGIRIIDGTSGGTTYLKSSTISLPATAGAMNGIALSGLWLPGSVNTAMTIEFSAAGGVNAIEAVWMTGVTVTD